MTSLNHFLLLYFENIPFIHSFIHSFQLDIDELTLTYLFSYSATKEADQHVVLVSLVLALDKYLDTEIGNRKF